MPPQRTKNTPRMLQPLNHVAVYNPKPAIRNKIPNSKSMGEHFPHECIPHTQLDDAAIFQSPSVEKTVYTIKTSRI